MNGMKTKVEITINNLKPCPCCGGIAHGQFEAFGTWVRITCSQCGLTTRAFPTQGYKLDPAAEAWNRRIGENDET